MSRYSLELLARISRLSRELVIQRSLASKISGFHGRPFSTRLAMEIGDAQPITAPPRKDQLISHDNKTFTTVREGKAHILVPPNVRTSVNPNAKAKADEAQKVFYNPIQQFNRDLSVLAIKVYGHDLCRRKTIAREARRKREEGKREKKKKLKKAGAENGETATAAGEGASQLVNGTTEIVDGIEKVDEATSPKKRKRTDEEGEEGPSQERKARKAGELGSAHDSHAFAASIESASGPEAVTAGHTAGGARGGATDHSTTSALDETGQQGAQESIHTAPDPSKAESTPWRPSFRILDALSATGLRALRYASEIPTATSVVANDRDRGATAAISLNVRHNGCESKITTSTGDAIGHMYAAAFPSPNSHGPAHISGKYDVIDLDPYGTAAPFIDAALQALHDEGMLCVTCTDSGVFASCGYSEKTYSLYGGMPIKGSHAHEGGLRLILHSIASSAAKYGLAIEPLLSLSIDFYARVFIRVRKSPFDVKFLAGKTALVYECDVGCGAWTMQYLGRHQRHGKNESSWKYHISMAPASDRMCEHCGSKTHIAGPMWGGPLHNPTFVEKILEEAETADKEVYQTLPRVEGMLDTALSELQVISETLPTTSDRTEDDPDRALIPPTPPHIIDHHPFYFIPSALCKVIKAVAPAEAAIRGALRRLGYVATRSHAKAGSLKTNAPFSVVWEVMREWVRQRSPVKLENLREGGPGWNILRKTRSVKSAETNGVASAEDGTKQDGRAAANAGADTTMADNSDSAATPTITTAATEMPQPPSKPEAEPGQALDVSKLDIVFDEKLGRDQEGGRPEKGRKKRLVRYQQNPRENWGPMARAKGHA